MIVYDFHKVELCNKRMWLKIRVEKNEEW